MATPFGLRALARKVLGKVSSAVARDGLFEQPGERPATPPLAPQAPAAPSVPAPGGRRSESPVARWASLDEAAARVQESGRPRLVNFWATWCIPCVEEFPALKALAASLGDEVDVFGISWDLFDPRGEPDEIREHVENFSIGHQLTWPSLVLRPEVAPSDFIARLGLTYDKIPQTWLIAADGTVLRRLHGPVEHAQIEELRRLLASPSSG